MKFSANLSFMFTEHTSLVERYKAAKAAGFTAVEVAFPYDYPVAELAEVKNSLGLEQVLLNTKVGPSLGHGARRGEEAEFMESIKTSLEYCSVLGVPRLHIMAGYRQDQVDRVEALNIFRDNLRSCLPLLVSAGVVGLIEPINPWSVPNYNMDSFQEGYNLVRELNHPNIKLQLDLFHLQQIEGNLSRNIQKYLPFVGHIQIAQVPSRGEPDSPGEIDYKYIFDLLGEVGYSGYVGLEYKPILDTKSGLKWITEMGKVSCL